MSGGPSAHYDLIAIGSGPAGRRAAVEAARLGGRVALVERRGMIGGVTAERGMLPFGTLRAAAMDVMAAARSAYRPPAGHDDDALAVSDLLWRADRVVEAERDAICDQLRRERVDVLTGTAAFTGPRTLAIRAGGEPREISGDHFVIAVGTRAARPDGVDFDDATVLDADGLLALRTVPRSLTVVGAGMAGLEYASVAAALGVRVTLVERRDRLPHALDHEIARAMTYHLRGIGVAVILGERVTAVTRSPGGGAVTHLATGRAISSEVVVHAGGRVGRTDGLGLAAAGLRAGPRGLLAVDDELRTGRFHILAAGEVAGGRGTTTATDQGRRAALTALGRTPRPPAAPLTHSVATIPEIAWVGATERDLLASGTPHVRGVARYRDLRRGEMAGDPAGLLTLLVHACTRRILGVHLLGTSASELVHVGQAVMAAGLPLDYLLDAVVEVPTYAEAYTLAARDARERLRRIGESHRCDAEPGADTVAA